MAILTKMLNLPTVHIFVESLTVLHYKMNLFNVMRRSSFRPRHQDTYVGPAACHLVSWGSWNFISGKCDWELDLEDSWDWAVGVSMDSWLRNTNHGN